MKLAFTSDLHSGASELNDSKIKELADYLNIDQPEAFNIIGDLGYWTNEHTESCLKKFKNLTCDKNFTAGNHCIYTWRCYDDSFEIYNKVLPQEAKDNNFNFLDFKPWIKDNVAIVGSINWYDLTWMDKEFIKYNPAAEVMYKRQEFFNGFHCDNQYVHKADRKRWNNKEFTDYVVARLEQQLRDLPSEVNYIVLATHHPAHRLMLPPKRADDDFMWTGYSGNERVENIAVTDKRIKLVVGGHTHWHVDTTITTPDSRPLQLINIGSSFRQKSLYVLDTETSSVERIIF